MPKPRTNADTIERWADSILEREPAPSYEVNSIIVSGDVVFSFGRHWPMGAIERDAKGRTRRVYLNSDSCASMGFANTNGDQGTVNYLARQAAERAGAEIVRRPMGTGWRVSGDGMIQCRPKDSDPRPPSDWSCEIPTVFHATDPGPEPVDDGVGCKVGQSEYVEYEVLTHIGHKPDDSLLPLYAQEQAYVLGSEQFDYRGAPRPGDFNYWHYYADGSGPSLYAKRMEHGYLTYREPKSWEARWEPSSYSPTTDIPCAHCRAFMREHEAWYVRYYGERWGRNRGKGWQLYSEMMERFGSAEEWREQRLIEFRRVREGRKTFAAWRERNYMPVSCLPAQGSGPLGYVPRLDREGYPFRKDSEAYFRMQRAAERNMRRAQREHEARARYERQVERFARGMRNRRKTTFTQRAATVAAELRQVREALETTTHEPES